MSASSNAVTFESNALRRGRSPSSQKRPPSKCYSNPNLLDVDAIKSFSSYHTKPLPEDPELLWVVFRRTLFFPLCRQWWTSDTEWPNKPAISQFRFFTSSLIYFLHALACVLYLTKQFAHCDKARLRWDIYLPIVILVVFSAGHAQVVSCTTARPNREDCAEAESDSDSDGSSGDDDDVEALDMLTSPLEVTRLNVSIWNSKGERMKTHLSLDDLRAIMVCYYALSRALTVAQSISSTPFVPPSILIPVRKTFIFSSWSLVVQQRDSKICL